MLVFLAMQSESEYTTTSVIAKQQHIPEPFLLRISADLARSGLIESRRGPGGGIKLAVFHPTRSRLARWLTASTILWLR